MVSGLIESEVINESLVESDTKDKRKLLEKLEKSFTKKDEDFYYRIIHCDTLLKEANRYSKEEEFDLAYIFYATYFEHLINDILIIWAIRNEVSYDTLKELFSRFRIKDKFTWLLEILKLPTFSEKYRKIIEKVSERRNSFIHYKYKPMVATSPHDADKKEWEKLKGDIERAVKYSKYYRSRVIYRGNKKKFKV